MRINIDCFLILIDRIVVFALVGEFLAAVNQDRDSDIGRHPKYFFPRIDNHKFRFALGLDLELARFAHNFNASVFGIAISLNLKFDRHLEQIEILLDLSQNFVTVLLPKNGVLELEFGNAAAIQPLIEEVPQIPAAGLRR